jgi:hypothetical protein
MIFCVFSVGLKAILLKRRPAIVINECKTTETRKKRKEG